MDVDWGLTVAVLSMVFTTFIGGITIRYTKRSLDYTKKSTQIADESLKAAQKSIETSIEIYNKQKSDEEDKNSKIEEREIKAIRIVVANELARFSELIVQIYKLRNELEKNAKKVIYNTAGTTFIIQVLYTDKEDEYIYFYADGNNIPFEVILKTATLDDSLYMDISDVKLQLNIIEKQLHIIVHIINMNSDNVLLLKNYFKQESFQKVMLEHYKVINYFSNEMKSYDIYEKLKKTMRL